jgi:hypothetical protein
MLRFLFRGLRRVRDWDRHSQADVRADPLSFLSVACRGQVYDLKEEITRFSIPARPELALARAGRGPFS